MFMHQALSYLYENLVFSAFLLTFYHTDMESKSFKQHISNHYLLFLMLYIEDAVTVNSKPSIKINKVDPRSVEPT